MTAFLIFLGFTALIVFGLIWDYRRICKRSTRRLNRPDHSKEWQWPSPKTPGAETHLGKEKLGDRRAA